MRGNAAVESGESSSKETGARRRVARAEGDAAISDVGLEKNDPGFFGLAGAHAATSASGETAGQSSDLCAVVQDPALMMVKQPAVVVGHVKVRAKPDLTKVGQAGNALTLVFCAAQGWKKESGKEADNQDNHEQFDQGEAEGRLISSGQ